MALRQNPENQLIALRTWAKNGNHEVAGEYIDEISSRDTRPQKEAVLRMLRLGEVQGVAFWSLDRWGRSMSELVLELEEFSATGKALVSLKEGFDLSSASGRLMANLLAAMANFERDMIRERVMSGLARAGSTGKIKGRHPQGCGCGKRFEDGRFHNGNIKPIRDEHNKFIGWDNEEITCEINRRKKRVRERAREIPMKASCEACGASNIKLERHHPNYNNPMEFLTLCVSCHKKYEKQTPPVQPTNLIERSVKIK